MESKVIEIIARVSKKTIEEIKDNMGERNLWDSFAHLELVLSLEEDFNIILEPEVIAEMRSPMEVIKVINESM